MEEEKKDLEQEQKIETENSENFFAEQEKQNTKNYFLGISLIFLIVFVVLVSVVFVLATNNGDSGDEVGNETVESNGNEQVVENGGVDVPPVDNGDDEDVYYFGVLPLQNPTEMLNRFGALENYLNEYTDMNIEMKFYSTETELGGFSAVVGDFIEDKLAFVFLAPVTTIQAYGNIGEQMEVIACGERYDGSPKYQGDLLVLKGSSYQSIHDLEGKPVAGTSISSTSGGLMPEGMLKDEEIDSGSFFIDLNGEVGGITYLGSHDKAVEALLTGVVEAAFVNEQTMYKFLEDGAEIRSIWRHDPVPEFPISANRNLVTEEQIEIIRDVLLNSYNVNPLIHQRVDKNYNRFVAVTIEDYLPVQEAIDNVFGPTFYDLDVWGRN